MSREAIDDIVALQDALIAALDARDIGRIERSTEALASAVAAARGRDVWADDAALHGRLGHALRQTEALRARVNYLATGNRERLDRLTEIRRRDAVPGFGTPGIKRNPALTR